MDRIQQNRKDGNYPFQVGTTFPRKVYGPSEYNTTLLTAGSQDTPMFELAFALTLDFISQVLCLGQH